MRSQPLLLVETPGLPNFHEVVPGLYRGAQPAPEGFRTLKAMGIKTIVNLRARYSDKDDVAAAGLLEDAFQLIDIPMHASDVDETHILRFLKVATDPSKRPLFFHCKHGADRTGTMTAAYRIVVQSWSKEAAIKEMTKGDFGFHAMFDNLPSLLTAFDVSKLRRSLGISAQ